MGTERAEMFSCRCPCGKGKLRVDHCTNDHAFADPDRYWFEGSVSCDTCREKYELRKVGRQFGLFDRNVRERNEKRQREAWDRKQGILQSEPAQRHFADCASLLDDQPSLAAVHRLLEGVGFWVSGIAKFRKQWRGGADWVRHRSPEVAAVLKALGKRDDALLEQLKKAEEHQTEADDMIGEPVYTLPRDT